MRNTAADIKTVKAMDPATLTATTWCDYIDLSGYDHLTIKVSYKASIADASNYFTPTIEEASATPASTASYSASTNYVGTISAVNGTTGGIQQWDYVGTKRYVTVKLTETGTASSIFDVTYILSGAKKGPARDNTVTTGTVS